MHHPYALSLLYKKRVRLNRLKMGIILNKYSMFIVSQNDTQVTIVEIKSNPDDVFFAMKQLEKSELVFRKIFQSIGGENVSIKKAVAIPPSKNPQLLKKAKDAKVHILIYSDIKDPDLSLFFTKDSQDPTQTGKCCLSIFSKNWVWEKLALSKLLIALKKVKQNNFY